MKPGSGRRLAGRPARGARARSGRWILVLLLPTMSNLAKADPEPKRPPPEAYALHCSGCHRLDGRGIPGIAPDLREIGVLLDVDGGRDYLGRVPGVAQAPVGDADLAALLNWVLTEIAHAPPDPAYTAREIAKLRAHPLRAPLAARRALLDPKP